MQKIIASTSPLKVACVCVCGRTSERKSYNAGEDKEEDREKETTAECRNNNVHQCIQFHMFVWTFFHFPVHIIIRRIKWKEYTHMNRMFEWNIGKYMIRVQFVYPDHVFEYLSVCLSRPPLLVSQPKYIRKL